MGCGQSKVKRANTTPIISRSEKLEEEKRNQNKWNDSKEVTNKMQVEDWNFVDENVRKVDSPKQEDTDITKKKDIAKEQQDLKKRRQKTEHMVAKLAKNNPEMLDEKSKEIISRLDNSHMTKSKQLEQIDPGAYCKRKTTLNNDGIKNYQSHNASVQLSSQQSSPQVIKSSPKKAVTVRPDFPGAATVSRNIISYNGPDKQKTSRASKRKDSNSDDDDFGINNSITVKASAVSRVQVGNVSRKQNLPSVTYSNNGSTLNGTQERQRNTSIRNEAQQQVAEKKKDLDNLLEELDDEDSGANFGKPPQESAIRIVNNQQFGGGIEEEEDDLLPPSSHNMHQDKISFEDNNNPLHDDGFDYNSPPHPQNNVMQFGDLDDDQNDDFGYNALEESNNSPSPKKQQYNNDDEDSKKGFMLDDLLDEDGFSVNNANDNHRDIVVKPHDKDPTPDDLLAEFDF